MWTTFKHVWRLKNATRVNLIIYGLRSLPLIKRLLPSSLYASAGLKRFASIVNAISRILGLFVWKIAYLAAFVLVPIHFLPMNPSAATHILLFLAPIGALLNADFFEMSKDSYYSIMLLRMNAKEYTYAGGLYEMVQMVVGYIVTGLILFPRFGVPIWVAVALPLFSIALKTISVALYMKRFKDGPNSVLAPLFDPIRKSPSLLIGLCFAFAAAAYVPPLVFHTSLQPSALAMAALVALPIALIALRTVRRFDSYRAAYRYLFTSDGFRAISEGNIAALSTDAMQKRIVYDASQTSDKRGYAFFNDLFVMRHKKLMTRSARNIALACLAAVLGFVLLATFMPDTREVMQNGVLHSLPMMLFAMYFLNRGRNVAQAMFMNCDHAMLTYRFYREPKVILHMFTTRLLTLLKINAPPTAVLASGLPAVLYAAGGADAAYEYLLLAVSVIGMSVFFSVHSLVLYYLLQPYNVNVETKNYMMGLADTLTYLACFGISRYPLSVSQFGIAITAFCVLYVAISLLLVFRLAPRTFRLRN